MSVSKFNSRETTIEVTFYVDKVTKMAMHCIRVEDLEDANPKTYWLPLSQVEIVSIDHDKSWYTVHIPEWLAYDKELI